MPSDIPSRHRRGRVLRLLGYRIIKIIVRHANNLTDRTIFLSRHWRRFWFCKKLVWCDMQPVSDSNDITFRHYLAAIQKVAECLFTISHQSCDCLLLKSSLLNNPSGVLCHCGFHNVFTSPHLPYGLVFTPLFMLYCTQWRATATGIYRKGGNLS